MCARSSVGLLSAHGPEPPPRRHSAHGPDPRHCTFGAMNDAAEWRAQRRQAYEAHAAALERKRAAEVAEARSMLTKFVDELGRREVEPEPLRARVPGSAMTYRTSVRGWYLRKNRSLGLSIDGDYYILDTSGGLRALLRGVDLQPYDPPLRIGVGARDGESILLEQLLEQRLTWPDARRRE